MAEKVKEPPNINKKANGDDEADESVGRRRRKKPEPSPIKQDIIGISLLVLALFALISNFSSSTGLVGFYIIKMLLRAMLGIGVYILPIFIAMLGIVVLKRQDVRRLNARISGITLLFFTFIMAAQVYSAAYFSRMSGPVTGAGGLIGYILRGSFERTVGIVGVYLIIIGATAVAPLLYFSVSLNDIWAWIAGKLFNAKKVRRMPLPKPKRPEAPVVYVQDTSVASQIEEMKCLPKEKKEESESSKRKKVEGINAVEKVAATRAAGAASGAYQLPSLDLLNKPTEREKEKLNMLRGEMEERKKVLESSLDSFGVKAQVTEVFIGPTVTRFEVQPDPGVKVSKIVNLSNDIALSLATSGVRIEAPVPGKSVVGIEVPNATVLPVHLGELLRTFGFQNSRSRVTFAVGKDISGEPVFADIAQLPHLLIAGTTGSGKSVCVNSLIISLLMRATPDEVKFLMINPKMVELSNYNEIPHLVAPVITDPKIASVTLKNWATKEMDRRYREFFVAGVRNIDAYNKKVERFERKEEKTFRKNGEAGDETFVPHKLPYIVIIVDELADLMMAAAADVETTICRIAQMARATGIHLVIATQRPSVDVITGLIKANVPSRISFAVATQVDSRVILDMAGAEKLLGRGDMLWNPIGAMKPLRMQGPYVSDTEIERVIAHVKAQRQPEYLDEVTDIKYEPGGMMDEGREARDELFAQAAQIIVDSGQSSTSHLQRRMRIGYNRAARLMDELEAVGIVSASEGENKPRRILASRQTLLELGLIAGEDFAAEPVRIIE